MKQSFICAKKNKRKVSILIAAALLCGNACFLSGTVTYAEDAKKNINIEIENPAAEDKNSIDPLTENGIVIGVGSKLENGKHNIAIGTKTISATGAISMGYNTKASDYAISMGYWDKQEAQVSGKYSVSFGYNAEARELNSISFGYNANVLGANSMAFGTKAKANDNESLAFGNEAETKGMYTIAAGFHAKVGKDYGNEIDILGEDGTGKKTTWRGQGSVAIGSDARAFGNHATAYGDNAKAYADGSIAIGQGANVGDENDFNVKRYGIAIGAHATVSDNYDIAIGYNANTEGDRGDASALSNTDYIKMMQQAGGSFAADSMYGMFSVGKTGDERRITNVAAGRINGTSTDAVNGSQLYWTWKALNDKIDGIGIQGDSNITVDKGTTSGGQTGTGSGETGSGSTETGVTSPKWNIKLNDDVTLGNESNGSLVVKDKEGASQVKITNGTVDATGNISAGSFSTGDININKNGTNTINGLSNTTWDSKNFTSGQAATEDQLKQVDDKVTENSNAISQMWNQNMSLNNRIDQVGAGAAALAGLHPLDFDPDDKFSVSAALGRYHGESAWAVGMYYQPNDDLLFSTSSTLNYDHNMYNFGVSLKLGHSQTYQKLNRAGMAAELSRLSEENLQIKKENEMLRVENRDIQHKLQQIMEKLGLH